MTPYTLIANPRSEFDVEAAFQWYGNEQAGLGLEFLDELRAAYDQIVDGHARVTANYRWFARCKSLR